MTDSTVLLTFPSSLVPHPIACCGNPGSGTPIAIAASPRSLPAMLGGAPRASRAGRSAILACSRRQIVRRDKWEI